MAAMLRMRELTEEEREQIKRLSREGMAPLRAVERARIVQLASEGVRVSAIAERLHIAEKVARRSVTGAVSRRPDGRALRGRSLRAASAGRTRTESASGSALRSVQSTA